jgi:copper chaperone CopZ
MAGAGEGVCSVTQGARVTTVLVILGMRGNGCRERVADALARVDGVEDVSVSLIRCSATVVHGRNCDPAALLRSVERAGYRASVNGSGRHGGGVSWLPWAAMPPRPPPDAGRAGQEVER